MADNEFEKLYRYLDEKFQTVDDRFVEVDSRFSELDRKFDRKLGSLEQKFEGKFSDIYSILDAIYGRLEEHGVELAALKAQNERFERWHLQIARKVNVQLEY